MTLLRPCLQCGEPTTGPHCPQHQPATTPKPSSTRRGYDTTWRKLPERLRPAQP